MSRITRGSRLAKAASSAHREADEDPQPPPQSRSIGAEPPQEEENLLHELQSDEEEEELPPIANAPEPERQLPRDFLKINIKYDPKLKVTEFIRRLQIFITEMEWPEWVYPKALAIACAHDPTASELVAKLRAKQLPWESLKSSFISTMGGHSLARRANHGLVTFKPNPKESEVKALIDFAQKIKLAAGSSHESLALEMFLNCLSVETQELVNDKIRNSLLSKDLRALENVDTVPPMLNVELLKSILMDRDSTLSAPKLVKTWQPRFVESEDQEEKSTAKTDLFCRHCRTAHPFGLHTKERPMNNNSFTQKRRLDESPSSLVPAAEKKLQVEKQHCIICGRDGHTGEDCFKNPANPKRPNWAKDKWPRKPMWTSGPGL